MNRRYAMSPSKSPARTGGEERPEPACADHLDLVDAVWRTNRPEPRGRLLELCGGCPVRAACWQDKKWRDALRGVA